MVKLTKDQVQFYKDNGFIILKNSIDKQQFGRISKEYDRIFNLKRSPAMETSWEGDVIKKAAGNKEYSVDSVHDLQFHSEVFSDLVTNKNLLEAMEDIMGTPNILLHHTKAHRKPPGKGAPYVMHQDYPYFPYKNHSMVAVVLAVDPCTPKNGGFCVYPGSHKNGPMEDHGYKGSSIQTYHWVDPKKYPIEGATPVILDAGDILVFSYFLLHGSYMNESEMPRRMFLMQLCDADDEPAKDTHNSAGQGWCLRGKNDKRPTQVTRSFNH
ncbi:phytanoyl-CoA dioxygenase (PhyH) domain-containing protein [Phthorimaea operculella]|nr:phytanoyl-CoA dioxygenase (PhyH) domain-containing protein [Phthorimaea operculella]